MDHDHTAARSIWNAARFTVGQPNGHYESWFCRANHPSRQLAFWIRYTIFNPHRCPDAAKGELWAIAFDGEDNRVTARKQEIPIHHCRFAADGLDAIIGPSRLNGSELEGSAGDIRWALEHGSSAAPLLLLPRRLYEGGFPKAKAMVGSPWARYRGEIHIGDRTWQIDDWVGSACHNWGSRHTDRYAWGQVSGFDDAPDVFLECTTAKVKLGPFWTPWVTMVVVREGDRELAINGLLRGTLAKAKFDDLTWSFRASRGSLTIDCTLTAPSDRFVGLAYANPPGGTKVCLNSKLASCRLDIREGGRSRSYTTAHRAAFELLTDEPHPRIPIVA